MTATKELAAGREMDALVAEKVMGYVGVRLEPSHVWKCLRDPTPEEVAEYGRHGVTHQFMPVKNYSTDVTADYEVLERVRFQWPLYLTTRFAKACETTWEGRGVSGFGAWLIYQPGDYSRAALAALDTAPTALTSTGRGRAGA